MNPNNTLVVQILQPLSVPYMSWSHQLMLKLYFGPYPVSPVLLGVKTESSQPLEFFPQLQNLFAFGARIQIKLSIIN